jgi:hypothetical protein
MPALTVGGRYTSPSGAHEVVVVRDGDGRWQVVDRAATDLTLVETLTGHDDRFEQAIAVADDYAAQQQAFHDGRREDDPLPRPSRDPRRAERGMSRDPAGPDGSPRLSPSVPLIAQRRRPAIDPAHARCSSATIRDEPTAQTHAMRLEGRRRGNADLSESG